MARLSLQGFGLSLLVALGSPEAAQAEPAPGRITGVVLDASSSRPFPGALVIASGAAGAAERRATTDAAGGFTLGDLPPGRYALTALADGFLPEIRADLVVGENVTLRATLALTPEAVHLEEVVVTGSRVRRQDLESPAPLLVISRDQIAASGKATIAEFLQELPIQGNALNANYNNGGDGSVRVAIRGLGDLRTAVLLNGRRFVAGGVGADATVDVGAIPSSAVERVEILMDGASPIYGSEAIGGVVNVITRKGWKGTEVSAQVGASGHGDGLGYALSLTTGRRDDQGSLLLSLGITGQEPVWSGNRDWSTFMWNYDATGLNSPLGEVGPYAVGSGLTPAGRIFTVAGPGVPQDNPAGDPKIDLYNTLVTTFPTATSFVPDPAAPLGWRPWAGGALPMYGGDQYNFQPDNYLVTPSQRLSLFASGDAKLGAVARGYFEASYVQRRSSQRIAPEPLLLVNDGITVAASNQFNPFGLDLPDVRGRLMGLGNRVFSQGVDTMRVVLGLDGLLPDGAGPLEGWAWDLSGAFGRSDAVSLKQGYTRISRLRDAVGPSYDYGAAGSPDWGCGTGPDDRIAGCVPLDVFAGGAVSQAAKDYLTYDGTARGSNQVLTAQATVNGQLFTLWAGRPAALALGYEYHQVQGRYEPDPITVSGDASTDGLVLPTAGGQEAHEAFAELVVPILRGVPFAEELEAQAAARVFRYSGFGTDWTWKVGLRWKPLQDLTLRGTLSTAYRAPSVTELHYGEIVDFFKVNDPCGGVDEEGKPEPISPWCGPAANPPEPIPRIRFATSGNPALGPETARVFTVGAVYQPRAVKELSITLDLYGVDIDEVIGWLSVSPLDSCYPMGATDVPRYCEYLKRDPATQVLTDVSQMPVNGGDERMWGVDLALEYGLETRAGRFQLGLEGSWLGAYDLQFSDGYRINARGVYDYGLYPELKFNAGLGWKLDHLSAGVDARYVGGFKECADVEGNFPGTACSNEHAFEHHVPPWVSWNTQLGYALETRAGRTDLAFGVENLLDTDPPRIYASYYPSDPGYGFLGRYFYARLGHRF